MDLRFGEKEEALRLEVRGFLQEHLAQDDGGSTGVAAALGFDDDFARAHDFNSKLADRGWIAPAWPTQYGGLGASIYEQMVFSEEFGYYGAPDTGTRGFGVGMIGPTLIIHGSDEQKARYLPGITSGEDVWCQGYSEPGAGSDLASLQTRAVRDGDGLRDQRLQDLDVRRPPRQPDVHPGPHRPGRPQTQGHQLLIIDDLKNTAGSRSGR